MLGRLLLGGHFDAIPALALRQAFRSTASSLTYIDQNVALIV